MESPAHLALKHAALRWLRDTECCAVALEVAAPIPRYRVDAAGYLDPRPSSIPRAESDTPVPRQVHAQTVVIECKQSRADFWRDSRTVERLLERRVDLERQRHYHEGLVREREPRLRRAGSSLFRECETWDYSASVSPGYRRVVRELRRVERQLYGETKFTMLAQYRLADRLYLAAPAGMIARRELPRSWGLLECPTERLAELVSGSPEDAAATGISLSVAVLAPPMGSTPPRRARLLRNMATTLSRAVYPRDEPRAHSRQ